MPADTTVHYTPEYLSTLTISELRGLPEAANAAERLKKTALIEHILTEHQLNSSAGDEAKSEPAEEEATVPVRVVASYRFTTFTLNGVTFQKRHPTSIQKDSELYHAVLDCPYLFIDR